MIEKIIEQIKTIPGVRTAFQVDDRIVVDLEEVDNIIVASVCEHKYIWMPHSPTKGTWYCEKCGKER